MVEDNKSNQLLISLLLGELGLGYGVANDGLEAVNIMRKEKFLEIGMNDYLSKPIEFKKLENILKKYLNVKK